MRRHRNRLSPRRRRGGDFFIKTVQVLITAAIVAGGVYGIGQIKNAATLAATDTNNCFVNIPTPARALLLIDVTDPMAAGQDRVVRSAVDRLLSELPDGGLLMASSIAGILPDQLSPIVETCKPAQESNRSRRLYNENFVAPLNAAIDRLARQRPALSSPILETILAAANDPALTPSGAPTTITVISDYMQFSPLANFYVGNATLPAPDGEPLSGITVRMLVFRNSRYAAVQPSAADAFARWLNAAGATVEYTPPAWMAVHGQPTAAMELARAN